MTILKDNESFFLFKNYYIITHYYKRNKGFCHIYSFAVFSVFYIDLEDFQEKF